MLFKRLNRSDAERIFAIFQANVAGVAANDVVILETNSASVDGVKVIQAGAGITNNATVGIADAAIANGAYGLVQIYGYRSTSRIELSGATLALGSPLGVKPSSDVLLTVASVSPAFLPAFVLLETLSSTAAATAEGTAKIFIRCM